MFSIQLVDMYGENHGQNGRADVRHLKLADKPWHTVTVIKYRLIMTRNLHLKPSDTIITIQVTQIDAVTP